VTPGTSALFVVTEDGDLDKVGERLQIHSTLIATNLTDAERQVLITMPSTDPHAEHAAELAPVMEQYPSILVTIRAVEAEPDHAFAGEFDAGLDLVLDGIERWRDASAPAGSRAGAPALRR